jgi:hypothetical protein
MAQVLVGDSVAPVARVPYLEWGPVIAGAIGASAISFLLLTFGAAIGLTLTSPWPDEGASAVVIALAVGWWAVMVQIGSFFAGGYLAGRMRSRLGDSVVAEGEFRDGTHGFLVWAVGVLIGAVVLAMTGGATLKTATQAASTIAAGATAGQGNSLATGPADYAIDTLMRPAPTAANAQTAATTPADATAPSGSATRTAASNDPALRAELGRIYASTIKNREMTASDRDYLTQVVANRTGLSQDQAQKRVDNSVQQVQSLEVSARQTAEKARKAGIIAAFTAAASLLISLAAACLGAAMGGRHRDENVSPHFYGSRIW